MSLRLLLDENMSHAVADQVRIHQPSIEIESVHTWRKGEFRGRSDEDLLLAAAQEELTIVTYDLKTIPPLIAELSARSQSHAGVIFVDALSITNDDFGTLTRALLLFWERYQALDWRNRVHFLDKPPR
jgi:predicted nuclease of predicted toxin-antitoxin system